MEQFCHPVLGYSNSHKYYANDEEKLQKYAQQREERGWDDTELFGLDHTIAKFLADRLYRFAEFTVSTPFPLTHEEWKVIIITIADGMALYTNLSDWEYTMEAEENYAKVDKAKALFVEWFEALWS